MPSPPFKKWVPLSQQICNSMQTTILDTHLHLYPCFDLPLAFNQFLDNTSRLGAQAARVACLAERHDCQYYQSMVSGETMPDGFRLQEVSDNQISLMRKIDGLSLTLIPGRQIISQERVEILALGCQEIIEDGQPALDVVYQIIQLGQVPVMPWSPGKWFGARGELIKKLITELEPGDFLIGDTPLRPYGWTTPGLMKLARTRGYAVVAGSDPLPFSGEENWLGAYCTVAQTKTEQTANELLHALKNKQEDLQWKNIGKRTHIFQLANRLRKNAASKKRPS